MRADLPQFLRFAVVGSMGFVIDGGLLWLLLNAAVDPYIARILSFPVAVVATWWLNRVWTFKAADNLKPTSQFGRYLGVQLGGALANYIIYAIVISVFGATTQLALAGFALGSLCGMAVNYLGSKHFAFKS